jgi:hypothetical protein
MPEPAVEVPPLAVVVVSLPELEPPASGVEVVPSLLALDDEPLSDAPPLPSEPEVSDAVLPESWSFAALPLEPPPQALRPRPAQHNPVQQSFEDIPSIFPPVPVL